MMCLFFTGKREHPKLVHCIVYMRDKILGFTWKYHSLLEREWWTLKTCPSVFSDEIIIFTILREKEELVSIKLLFVPSMGEKAMGYAEIKVIFFL